MTHAIKMSLWAAALALVACGPGAKIGNGKQGAAEALYAASVPTKGAVDRGANPIDLPLSDLSVSCQFGGKATLKSYVLKTDTGSLGASLGSKFNIVYDNCGAVKAEVGVANINGSLEVNQVLRTGSLTVAIEQSMKGKLTFNGAFDDFLDADVTERLDASALGSTSGSVALTLAGKVSNSGGSYEFNEAVNVTAGNLSVQVTKN